MREAGSRMETRRKAWKVFRLDAATATNSFFYDVGFGVEGTIPAVILEILVLVLVIVIGRKLKRKHTDIWAEAEM
ncbi:MAG TPA: hypothetical protein DCF49_10180 [Lachnospiraceae bacterium]|nr:hypothetical protein [Lachnospiraceae bacterium]